jgi:hypothetical protein
MEFYSSSLLRWLHEVMSCQVVSATASLIDALKAGPWCLQRTLDLEKISTLNLPWTWDSLAPVSGGGDDAQVSQ